MKAIQALRGTQSRIFRFAIFLSGLPIVAGGCVRTPPPETPAIVPPPPPYAPPAPVVDSVAPRDSLLGAAAIQVPDTFAGPAPAETADTTILPGIDVLVRAGGGPLRGLRVGLITNHTGRGADGTSTIDLLAALPEVDLAALFGPEHGIRGAVEGGESVESGRDAKTGVPIYSLYGETREPTAAMLSGLDALVFDIQDVGARYYTYVWTMALAMRAAARSHVRFVVLDRPDPIGGRLVQGNVLDTAFASFVGLYPVPMRYGLTPGELARWINAAYHVGAELTVVPVQGWRRGVWYDETALPWVPPSPNMPSLESATHYPGTCIFEGTNLSVGRGTPIAFQQIGAPWIDSDTLAARMNALGLAGVRFEATSFTPDRPGDGKYPGVEASRGPPHRDGSQGVRSDGGRRRRARRAAPVVSAAPRVQCRRLRPAGRKLAPAPGRTERQGRRRHHGCVERRAARVRGTSQAVPAVSVAHGLSTACQETTEPAVILLQLRGWPIAAPS